MTRSPVQFGLGDLESILGSLVADEVPAEAGDQPPAGRAAFVHTGDVFVSATSTVASTILGSCVAVCLWDARAGVGGINHFLLPWEVENGISSTRYGNVATRALIARLEALGSRRTQLLAKVFGGASVLDTATPAADALGARNVAFAERALAEAGIPIVSRDVGGTRGRKLYFRTDDGSAWVRKL
ncbi:MAG TPA: chemotaxis protein CheD [Gemmatimonadales bacterium]|nr:chemotaxis protein CheD [Gemmatimonadales bacterium]